MLKPEFMILPASKVKKGQLCCADGELSAQEILRQIEGGATTTLTDGYSADIYFRDISEYSYIPKNLDVLVLVGNSNQPPAYREGVAKCRLCGKVTKHTVESICFPCIDEVWDVREKVVGEHRAETKQEIPDV